MKRFLSLTLASLLIMISVPVTTTFAAIPKGMVFKVDNMGVIGGYTEAKVTISVKDVTFKQLFIAMGWDSTKLSLAHKTTNATISTVTTTTNWNNAHTYYEALDATGTDMGETWGQYATAETPRVYTANAIPNYTKLCYGFTSTSTDDLAGYNTDVNGNLIVTGTQDFVAFYFKVLDNTKGIEVLNADNFFVWGDSTVVSNSTTQAAIRAAKEPAAPSGFMFTVTNGDMMDGLAYVDSSAIPPVIPVTPLDVVAQPTLADKVLTWSSVAHASSYTVVLSKDGVAQAPITNATSPLDLTTTINALGSGSYTATVQAIGDGTNYTTSAASTASAAYVYSSVVTATSVSVDQATLDLVKGATATTGLTATVLPVGTTNTSVTWSSETPGVATVDANTGIVTAVEVGTAKIYATTADGSNIKSTNYCTVTVSPVPTNYDPFDLMGTNKLSIPRVGVNTAWYKLVGSHLDAAGEISLSFIIKKNDNVVSDGSIFASKVPLNGVPAALLSVTTSAQPGLYTIVAKAGTQELATTNVNIVKAAKITSVGVASKDGVTTVADLGKAYIVSAKQGTAITMNIATEADVTNVQVFENYPNGFIPSAKVSDGVFDIDTSGLSVGKHVLAVFTGNGFARSGSMIMDDIRTIYVAIEPVIAPPAQESLALSATVNAGSVDMTAQAFAAGGAPIDSGIEYLFKALKLSNKASRDWKFINKYTTSNQITWNYSADPFFAEQGGAGQWMLQAYARTTTTWNWVDKFTIIIKTLN